MTEAERQAVLDEEQLRLLRIGFLVTGIVSAVAALFALFYFVMMGFVFSAASFAAPRAPGAPDPRLFGLFFAVFGGLFFLFLAGSAALKLGAASALRRRRGLTLCKIAAGVSCVFIPYGTLIGVFAFQILSRPTVIALFAAPQRPVFMPPPPMPPPMP